MPSRADRIRVGAEWALRAIALALLAVLLWRALVPAPPPVARALVAQTPAAVRERDLPAERLHVRIDAPPSAVERAWLRALAGAGTAVTWSAVGDGPLPIAIGAVAVPDPRGGVVVRAAAPRGTPVRFVDAVGTLDSVRAEEAGAVLRGRALTAPVAVVAAGTRAAAPLGDSLVLRRVLLLADIGWEGKFVAAALEEAGWPVDARYPAAPGVQVVQGEVAAIDTARYAAVIALDSTAAPHAARIATYVRSGGGLVLGPTAPTARALGAVAPARVGALMRPSPMTTPDSVGRAALPLYSLRALADDAIVLERRADAIAVAAWRVHAGRVVQLGYAETWRWRMLGGDGELAAHRDWWANAVASVAYAPVIRSTAQAAAVDPAPLAQLVAALGPASPLPEDEAPGERRPWTAWMAMAIVLALLAEWSSRRLRGAR